MAKGSLGRLVRRLQSQLCCSNGPATVGDLVLQCTSVLTNTAYILSLPSMTRTISPTSCWRRGGGFCGFLPEPSQLGRQVAAALKLWGKKNTHCLPMINRSLKLAQIPKLVEVPKTTRVYNSCPETFHAFYRGLCNGLCFRSNLCMCDDQLFVTRRLSWTPFTGCSASAADANDTLRLSWICDILTRPKVCMEGPKVSL